MCSDRNLTSPFPAMIRYGFASHARSARQSVGTTNCLVEHASHQEGQGRLRLRSALYKTSGVSKDPSGPGQKELGVRGLPAANKQLLEAAHLIPYWHETVSSSLRQCSRSRASRSHGDQSGSNSEGRFTLWG